MTTPGPRRIEHPFGSCDLFGRNSPTLEVMTLNERAEAVVTLQEEEASSTGQLSSAQKLPGTYTHIAGGDISIKTR